VTIAAHMNHLRFSLHFANRALRGEDAYPTADWKASWVPQQVDEVAWQSLRVSLRGEYPALRQALQWPEAWASNDELLTEVVVTIAHCAYQLAALRQMVRSLGLRST